MTPHRLQDLLRLIRNVDTIEQLDALRSGWIAEVTPAIDAAFSERVAQIKRGQ